MKKRSFYSLAALLAAACLPAGSLSMYTFAAGETASAAQISPDSFIETYCGYRTERVDAAGKVTSEFVWFSTLTDENAPVLAASRPVFEAMSEADQQIVCASARAFGVDYPALSLAAIKKLTPPTPEPSVETPALEQPEEKAETDGTSSQDSSASEESSSEENKNTEDTSDSKADSSKPEESEEGKKDDKPSSNDASTSDSSNSSDSSNASDADSSTDSSQTGSASTEDADKEETDKPAQSQQPSDSEKKPEQGKEEKPADSKPAPDSPADPDADINTDPDENEEAGAENAVPNYTWAGGNLNLLPSAKPSGLEVVEYPAVGDPVSSAVARILAEQAGWPAHVLMPVSYTYTVSGTQIQSKTYWRVSINDLMMLFDYTINADGSVYVNLYSHESCAYDLVNGLTLPIIGHALLQIAPAVDAGASEEITAETARISETLVQAADLRAAGDESSAQALRLADFGVQNPAETENKITIDASPVLMQLDASANSFISQYCTYGGALITSVNGSNYQTVLNGATAWNALSNSQRKSVNDHLIANGSTRFQTLYQQANQYRLGMPVRQGTGTAGSAAPVNTAVSTGLLASGASFVLSALGLGGLSVLEKRNRTRKK